MSRLKERYQKEIIPALMKQLGYKNVMQVPRLEKIVLNIGLGEAIQEGKTLEAAWGERMSEVFDRLVNAVLPRIREFQVVSTNAFDMRGNYTLGLKDQIPFPEVDYDQIDKARGLEVSIVTTANTDDEGRNLLELLGMPFAKDGV